MELDFHYLLGPPKDIDGYNCIVTAVDYASKLLRQSLSKRKMGGGSQIPIEIAVSAWVI